MQLRGEKKAPLEKTPPSTTHPEARGARAMTARMQFYVVQNMGEQLRWSERRRTGRTPDRMVGR